MAYYDKSVHMKALVAQALTLAIAIKVEKIIGAIQGMP